MNMAVVLSRMREISYTVVIDRCRTGECKYCGGPIWWVLREKGQAAGVDQWIPLSGHVLKVLKYQYSRDGMTIMWVDASDRHDCRQRAIEQTEGGPRS
jgi:hypothetical protein